jgi:hypothetical protein
MLTADGSTLSLSFLDGHQAHPQNTMGPQLVFVLAARGDNSGVFQRKIQVLPHFLIRMIGIAL